MCVQRTRFLAWHHGEPLTRPLGGQTRSRSLIGFVWGIAVTTFVGCARDRFNTYTLAAGTEPGWVIVEFENPACPALPKDFLGRSIAVPASRYACTSEKLRLGWAPDRYYLAASSGDRKNLKLDRDIHNVAGFAFGGGKGRCKMVGERFFFGPSRLLTKSEDYAAAYPLHHEGCDPSVPTQAH